MAAIDCAQVLSPVQAHAVLNRFPNVVAGPRRAVRKHHQPPVSAASGATATRTSSTRMTSNRALAPAGRAYLTMMVPVMNGCMEQW